MSTHNSVQQAVRLALCGGAAVAASVSLTANAADDTPIQEVVVTGSRIQQPNLTGTTPVTQVTAADIAVQGVTRVEDLVNQLPQAFAAQNANVANGATGAATVNLRGLGSPRTLVLIDGRRLPYGSTTNSAADLNTIPSAIVERVDLLTGGASAVYGSDAVAGVVNFVTKKDFEGIQIEGQYGFYQHNNDFGGPGQVKLRDQIAARAATNPDQFALPSDNVTDGFGRSINIMMGVSTDDGRGNITAWAGVEDQDQVLQRDRDFSACSLATATPNVSFGCGGSGTSYPGQFTDFGANFVGDPGPDGVYGTADDDTDTDINPMPEYNLAIDQGTGNFRPFDNTLDQYNFGPVNHFLRPNRRYNLGAIGHYELNDHADVYTQLMYTNYRSVAQIAPGGIFFDTATINCDNPYLSAQQAGEIGCGALAQQAATQINPVTGEPFLADPNVVPLYIGRRNVEGGGRQQSFRNAMFRGLVGVRGDITSMWQYDVSAQFSSTSVNTETLNYFVIDRISRALDVVSTADGPACRSVVDGSDPDCVPYNVFDPNGITPETLAYLQAPGIQSGTIDQEVYIGQVTGDTGWTIPTAQNSIKVAFGAEYRRDSLENTVDALQSQNRLSGAGGATIGIAGATKVVDLFTEVNVPLIQDMAFADQLGFDGAYRHSDYGDINTDTYKLGLDWAPIEDVRFRASYQRAVRAANVVELFTAQGFNLFDMEGDPCGEELEGTDGAATDDACLNSGPTASVSPGQLRSGTLDSPAGQYNFLQGGDPNLTPEESDTTTFGVILQPRFLPGFTMTVDYFNIKIEDTISTIGPQVTLDACYINQDPAACARINRNPANGSLWIGDGNVVDLNTNIGSLETTGYDISMNYAGLEIGKAGSLSFSLTGTYLDELVTDPGTPGTTPYDCAGKFASSCASGTAGVPSPKWRHHARIGWQTPWPVDVSLTWRYFSEVEMFGVPSSSARIDRVLSEENYFDLAANWSVMEKASIMFGINNILDNDPSINNAVGTTGNGNTYPQLYDALGRYVFMRGTIGF